MGQQQGQITETVGGAALGGLLEAAREIAARRSETIAGMKAALERGDREEALKLAARICGVDYDKTCD